MKLVKGVSIALALASIAVVCAPPAGAQERPLETYTARLSEKDHFNSNGERLRTAAGIIRQDRANYHEFRRRDGEDEGDRFFASKANRARLEALLLNGHTTRSANDAIINGTPLVTVEVYENFVNVYVR
jgi:hypothetical protein